MYPLASGGTIEFFLAKTQLVQLRFAEALAEEVAEDLRIALAEGGGEVVAVEGASQGLAHFGPGLEVHLRGIDQRAVDVPDDGPVIGRRHNDPFRRSTACGRRSHLLGQDE